jgi:hypothetical protein
MHVVASDVLRTVVLSGDMVPGTALDFGSFAGVYPQIDRQGLVSFGVSVTDKGSVSPRSTSFFREKDGVGIQFVVSVGDTPPEADFDVTFSSLNGRSLNDSGQSAFLGFTGTKITSSELAGIYSEGAGNGLALIAREGEVAPGIDPIARFKEFDLPVLSNSGHIAFLGSFEGPNVNDMNNRGLFIGISKDELSLVARTSQPVVDVGGAAFLYRFSNRMISINDTGQIAFAGHLAGSEVDNTNDTVVFSADTDGLRLVAREGDTAPGPGSNWIFSSSTRGSLAFGGLNINNEGQATFLAFLSDSGEAVANQTGIFSEVGGNGLQLVIRSGEQAPGADQGVYISQIYGIRYNDRGEFAFIASLDSASTDTTIAPAVFSNTVNEGLRLVAGGGDAVPGVDGELRFALFGNSPWINDRGQTMFQARLAGPGVDQSNNVAIFAEDIVGNLQLIAREGEIIDVSDNPLATDLRKISRLDYFSGVPGGMNDRGEAL